jgi:ATP-dependent exoDNAse (exonuclease V) alpha subunit
VESALAITFHKLQGKTVSKIILDLRKRPGSGAGIKDVEFEGMYVGWTRVRRVLISV